LNDNYAKSSLALQVINIFTALPTAEILTAVVDKRAKEENNTKDARRWEYHALF
jgi:hypothetical protein